MNESNLKKSELLEPKLKEIEETIKNLLFEKSDPIVLALQGGWGEGKTYFWKNSIVKNLPLEAHGYISAFNADSLDTIRNRIIVAASQSRTTKLGRIYGLEGAGSVIKKIGTEGLAVASNFVSQNYGFSESLITNVIEKKIFKEGWILCIDDIERISKNIEISTFLGYVNLLREEYNIKVVLIYNKKEIDDKWGEDRRKIDFEKYFEKVVDRLITFDPDQEKIIKKFLGGEFLPSEQLEIAINKCRVLEYKNIRMIKRVRSFYEEVVSHLNFTPDIDFYDAFLTSLFLFSAVKYSPDLVYKIDFKLLKDWNLLSSRLQRSDGDLERAFSDDEDEEDNEEMKVDKLLSALNYTATDEFDLILMNFIDTGILKIEELENEFNKYQNNVSRATAEKSYRDVWYKFFHGTMRDTTEEFCDNLIQEVNNYMPYIPLNELDGALVALDKFGRGQEANELLQRFVRDRSEVIENYDPDRYITRQEYAPLTEVLFRQINRPDERTLEQVMESALSSTSDFLKQEDRRRLADFSADDLYNYFCTHDCDRLLPKIRDLFKMTRQGDEHEQRVHRNIAQVARRFAQETELGRFRMESMNLIPRE